MIKLVAIMSALVLLQGCAQDNAGAASDPNSFALTGDFIAGEYVLEVRPNPPRLPVPNPLL